MRTILSRRDTFGTAIAAALAPLFARLWPSRAKHPRAALGASPCRSTTTYHYDDQGRLLSVTTREG